MNLSKKKEEWNWQVNNFSFSIFNIIAVFLIVLFAVYAICPFDLIDMKQAERIAKWKSQFEQLNYCFELVEMHEGMMAQNTEVNEDIANKLLVTMIKPYFSLAEENLLTIEKYAYRRKNGRLMPKNSQFYFDKFLKGKDGSLISFRKNLNYTGTGEQPLYYMFVDINGELKPNRVGEDIFFIDVFEHKIKALGYDKEYARMKKNCSPMGSGLYCSEFYLLGGHF